VHPVTCSLLWVRCLFDQFSISDFWGKWPIKFKFSRMSFHILWRDTKIRFMTKFGENRLLESCRKVVWFTTQTKNLGSAGLVWVPIMPKMGRSSPKLPERCHPSTCPRIPNLVRIGCVLPDLFRKDWFFSPKSQYNIGFQPTIKWHWNQATQPNGVEIKHYIGICDITWNVHFILRYILI